MTIETKYNIGDEVWFMCCNRIGHATIKGYQICYGEGEYYGNPRTGRVKCSITYITSMGGVLDAMNEENFFPTKEELLNSL